MAEPARRYALVTGINHYQTDQIGRLSFAQADARAMADLLESLGFSVRTLLGPQATQAAMESELLALSSLPREEVDLLVVFFSGHGDADNDGRAYLLLWDFDNAAGTGRLNLDDLRERYIEGAKARQVYGILDSCNSGQAAGEVSVLRRAQKVDAAALKEQTAAMFQDLRGGRVVLTAVAGDQAAKEISTLNHSLLTYYLLKGWAEGAALDGEGMLDTELLYSYVTREIMQNYPTIPTPVQGGYLEGTIVLPTPFPAAHSGVAETLALLDAATLAGVGRRLRHLPNEERSLISTSEYLAVALETDPNDGRLAALVAAVIEPEGADLLGLQWVLAARLLKRVVEDWPDGDAPGLGSLITRVHEEAQRRLALGGPLAERWARAVVSTLSGPAGGALLARLNDATTPPAERERLMRMFAELGTESGQALVTAILVILSGGPVELLPTAAQVFCRLRPAGAERAVTLLAGHLGSADPAARLAAAQALAALETTEIGPALEVLRPLVQAPDGTMRTDAVAALGLVAGRGGSDQAAPLLVAALEDAEAPVRAAAVTALSRLIWAPGPAMLKAALPADPATPLEASGTARQEVAARLIAARLNDPDQGVRHAALEALGRLGRTAILAAQPALLALLPDPDLNLRIAAIRTLGALPPGSAPAEVTQALVALLTDADGRTRGAAAVALAAGGQPEAALPALHEAIANPDPAVAGPAAAALATAPDGQAAALPILLGLLRDPDPAVVAAATTALAHPALLAPVLAAYEQAPDDRLLAPLALLVRTHNIRILPGGQVVRADGTTVAAADYKG